MIDLHMHSTYSDGTFSPEQLVLESKKKKMKAIALTDHNTIGGLSSFLAAGRKHQLNVIPGIEISTEYEGVPLHIVALNVRPESYASINLLLEVARNNKERSNRQFIDRLNKAFGYTLSYDEIVQSNTGETINRANIAAYLMKCGCITSVEEGFKTILHLEAGYYVPAARLQALDVISVISNEWLSIPILAHPLKDMTEEQLVEFLPKAKACGLEAMEVYCSCYSKEQEEMALRLAKCNTLKRSGGSDFHGDNKPDIRLGVGRGDLLVPDEVLDELYLLFENEERI